MRGGGLAIYIPAEEVMLHQHVLNSLLKRFLLVFLEIKDLQQSKMSHLVMSLSVCM